VHADASNRITVRGAGSFADFAVEGPDPESNKHIMGIEVGAAENAASVKRVLTRLRGSGLADGPEVSIRDRRC
jgi:transposase-like protein